MKLVINPACQVANFVYSTVFHAYAIIFKTCKAPIKNDWTLHSYVNYEMIKKRLEMRLEIGHRKSQKGHKFDHGSAVYTMIYWEHSLHTIREGSNGILDFLRGERFVLT